MGIAAPPTISSPQHPANDVANKMSTKIIVRYSTCFKLYVVTHDALFCFPFSYYQAILSLFFFRDLLYDLFLFSIFFKEITVIIC